MRRCSVEHEEAGIVKAIENWAELSGSVREVRHRAAGRSELLIAVERAEDVAGFPNLLAGTPGRELAVSVATDAVERMGLRGGDAIVCRAQRAGPRSVVAQPASLARR